MERQIADLTRRKMKAKSKAAKDKEDQVHSALLAKDATRASVKSSDLVSKPNRELTANIHNCVYEIPSRG